MPKTSAPRTINKRPFLINNVLDIKKNLPSNTITLSIFATILGLTICLSNNNVIEASFVDSSALKPSILLILPQSFKVPASNRIDDDGSSSTNKLQQYVAVVNNVQNDRDDLLLRQQYKKLTLQVRDARVPITGQLYFEHVFDYFPPSRINGQVQQQHLLIPVNLEQVSPTIEQFSPAAARNYAAGLTGVEATTVNRPQQLIVSIRPYQLDSGFGSDSIEFVSSVGIPVESVPSTDGKRSFGIIQTDKPIYKPDDKVRIRSMVVDENFKPIIKDELRIQVRNPQKLIVEEMRFPNQYQANNSEQFFINYIFEFPPEPMLGIWSVHLLHSDPIANDSTSFEVKEYVLPTYEIEFNSPKYILPTTQNITGFITAKYHYGKPVQGKAQFKFGFKESPTAKARWIARSSIKNVDSQTGRVDFRIGSDKFKETDGWFPTISGSRLVIEATVTEMTTGHREIAEDTSCTFMSMPYKISVEDTIEDFKIGLTQQLSVKVFEIQNTKPASANLLMTADYQDQNGNPLDSQTTGSKPFLDKETYTDFNGRATFNIGPMSEDISSIRVTMRLYNTTKHNKNSNALQQVSEIPTELAVNHHTLVKHESMNGWLSLMNKTITQLNIGDQFVSDIVVRDAAVVPQKIYYLIVSRGHIIALNNVDLGQGLIKFQITQQMMPSIRVVLFALTQDSVGLLSDSMRINVGQDMSCGLSVSYKSSNNNSTTASIVKPNDKGKISIKARHGDVVSLIGVDSAVYTLKGRRGLEASRIVERVKRLDSGCGFGGGRNNLDVFHNSGLMLFKDVANSGPNLETTSNQLGTTCLTLVNQLKHLEDIQLGYSKPLFSAASQIASRPRSLELAIAVRQKLASSSSGHTRTIRSIRSKREVDVDNLLKKYNEPLAKSCCRLGTMEDLPQRRNCSVRARIVDKYMRHLEFKACSTIYLECCRAIYGEQLSLSIMFTPRDQHEPVIEARKITTQYSEPIQMPNMDQLDRIEAQTLIRRDFKETWLFELVEVSTETINGVATLDVQLPHSITSWTISAMALNLDQPMCIMPQPFKITTFQEIFLQVSMPYKVIQGEQIDLVVTVFNYSPLNQDVLVYMYGVEDVCSEAEPGERSERKRVRLEKHSSQSVLFPMIPLKTGKYPIKLLAVALNPTGVHSGSDIVERVLNVVPRGKQVTDETTFRLDPLNHQRRSKRAIQTGNLVDEIDSSKGLQRSKIRLTPSRDSEYIVPQTQECIISAIGDKMGQVVQTTMIDVESLIRLPHGCGEQVMIYLGPTLYTARYLSAIDKLSGDIRWRAIKYIQSGYKRILNYRKDNGAFSAFARRDASIWLTAFIAKMLCQTERTPFVAEEIHVDKNVINSALNWLVDIQNKDTGTWIELNPVYHREMLGGVLRENALTAFVTLSLNECAHHSPDLIDEVSEDEMVNARIRADENPHTNGVDKLKVATQKAEQALLLDRYKAVKERNPYVLALTAYALSFSRPKDAAAVLNDLILFAERSQSRNQLFWRGDYQIETAAYALQALIELAPVLSAQGSSNFASTALKSANIWQPGADALSITNWLSSRRSYSGAFESTQDTVVALEALSKFAQLQASPNGNTLIPQSTEQSNLVCNVTMSNRTRRSIEFDKNNAQVLQTLKLDRFEVDSFNGEMLDIVTSGNGLGTMSVKLKYNVFYEEDELCRFNIDSSIEEWQPKLRFTASDMSGDLKENKNDGTDLNSNESPKEEDYFKNFDKSMLSELNLIDLNQLEIRQLNANNGRQTSNSKKETLLRLKRHTKIPVMDLSTKNLTQESWTSKVVSTLKTKLPSWLSPKQTSANTTADSTTKITTKPPEINISQVESTSNKKTNTSRRSPNQVPMIVHSTGIPSNVKLNVLSKELELIGQNETFDGLIYGNGTKIDNSTHHMTHHPSHRLVLLLRTCIYHIARRDSEMAVIEVGILSGFKPNEADLKEIVNEVGTPTMKYELSPDKSLVIIYMRYIPFSGPFCLQFRLIRDSLVYNLQSGYIRAYEYYTPTHSCSNFYTPSRVTDLIETKCDTSGQVCQCASKSMCPSTNKLVNFGEVHTFNSTRARNQLIELVCSKRFDLISMVRLKSVRYFEAGKTFKLKVKVKSDLKGNLTKIMEAQRHQKKQIATSIRKPLVDYILPSSSESGRVGALEVTEEVEDEENSLEFLNLNIDSGCVRNDPLLLHLAHPNQWKQGGELILFGRSDKLERRNFKTIPKASKAHRSGQINSPLLPRPKPNILSSDGASGEKLQESSLFFEDAHQLQYSTNMLLDKDSILHDLAYKAKVEPRETINNLIMWLELRTRRDRLICESASVH